MNYRKTGLIAGACAAACAAPLALAPLLAGAAVTGIAARFASEWLCVLPLAVVALGWFIWRTISARRQCSCAPDGGCSENHSCAATRPSAG